MLSVLLATGCAMDEDHLESAVQSIADPSVPPSLGTLEAWFDGTRGVTISGGQVIAWDDQSGHGRTLGRASLTPPPMTSAVYPGMPKDSSRAVCFDQALSPASGLVNSGFVLKQPFTVAIALRPTQEAAAFALSGIQAPTITLGPSVSPPSWPPQVLPPDTWLRATAGIGDTYTEVKVAQTQVAAPHVMVAIFDGPSSLLFVDGMPRGTRGDLTPASLTGIVLSPEARPFSGCIGEVLVYGDNIGAYNATVLSSYLRDHYGP